LFKKPVHSPAEMIDHLKFGGHSSHAESMAQAYQHVKGDGYTAAMDKPRESMRRLKKL
jgi:hypothetical protein